MAYVTIIAMLALIEYLYFGMLVGQARGRSGLQAPAVTGDESFERGFRAHDNTLEHLIVFVPALDASGHYVGPLYAVAAGVAFLIGRAMYFRTYVGDPGKRGPGMMLTFLANGALVVGALVGALLDIL